MSGRYDTRGRLKCLICKTGFPDEEQLNTHYTNSHRRNILRCRICAQIFTSKVERNRHWRRNPIHCPHRDGPTTKGRCKICLTCLHFFVDADDKCIECRIQTYKCDYCQERFYSEGKRDLHLSQNPDHCVHPELDEDGYCTSCTNKNLNACLICERVIFGDKSDRIRHYSEFHGINEPSGAFNLLL